MDTTTSISSTRQATCSRQARIGRAEAQEGAPRRAKKAKKAKKPAKKAKKAKKAGQEETA